MDDSTWKQVDADSNTLPEATASSTTAEAHRVAFWRPPLPEHTPAQRSSSPGGIVTFASFMSTLKRYNLPQDSSENSLAVHAYIPLSPSSSSPPPLEGDSSQSAGLSSTLPPSSLPVGTPDLLREMDALNTSLELILAASSSNAAAPGVTATPDPQTAHPSIPEPPARVHLPQQSPETVVVDVPVPFETVQVTSKTTLVVGESAYTLPTGPDMLQDLPRPFNDASLSNEIVKATGASCEPAFAATRTVEEPKTASETSLDNTVDPAATACPVPVPVSSLAIVEASPSIAHVRATLLSDLVTQEEERPDEDADATMVDAPPVLARTELVENDGYTHVKADRIVSPISAQAVPSKPLLPPAAPEPAPAPKASQNASLVVPLNAQSSAAAASSQAAARYSEPGAGDDADITMVDPLPSTQTSDDEASSDKEDSSDAKSTARVVQETAIVFDLLTPRCGGPSTSTSTPTSQLRPVDAQSLNDAGHGEPTKLGAGDDPDATMVEEKSVIEPAGNDAEEKCAIVEPPPTSPKNKRAHDDDDVPTQRRSPKRLRLSGRGKIAAASQARSFKKLATPFRSPLAANPASAPSPAPLAPRKNTAMSTPVRSSPLSSKPPAFKKPAPAGVSRLVRETTDAAVTSPYRSPVASSSAAPSVTILTVQALERRVQLLKRAIKIKQEGGDDALEKLTVKWRAAARAASWDLWTLVKDGQPQSQPGGEKKSWGYDDGAEKKDKGWGWDDTVSASDGAQEVYEDVVEEQDEPEVKDPSIGTMLAELGIAPDTLGWKEEEGEFVDA
ncbi:hypothetical protein EXIGLDRAFT_828299 [Exidia glandulosa HHB12029]|uniref:Uncharacterized protein n=1 Tax=Exidia glandulosa HHB12029 TaxID=1314781 RepID=A0A165R2Z0_EXIGL|nr:hypothetical protein EXIGLDRAFT_828299 [Exidia glandulosa HHB12029]